MSFSTLHISAKSYWFSLLILLACLVIGLAAAHYIEQQGHWVTGMTNQIAWGLPHVIAILFVVTASGVLNIASLGSVFGMVDFKPLARMSALLAVAFLAGGLLILVLDLGRPDRLIVAMTTYNFKSVFAWNIFLYTGFVLVVLVYSWTLFEQKMGVYTGKAALFAFLWRIILTTGTGCIFGFLVARDAYDAAIMAPLFVAMSLSTGTAVFLLGTALVYRVIGNPFNAAWLYRLRTMMGIFVAVVFYFVIVQYLAGSYYTQRHGVVRFILLEGGFISAVFWNGQILVGTLLPLLLCFYPRWRGLGSTLIAAGAVVLGTIAQLYVIIIGGQAYPMDLFPANKRAAASTMGW